MDTCSTSSKSKQRGRPRSLGLKKLIASGHLNRDISSRQCNMVKESRISKTKCHQVLTTEKRGRGRPRKKIPNQTNSSLKTSKCSSETQLSCLSSQSSSDEETPINVPPPPNSRFNPLPISVKRKRISSGAVKEDDYNLQLLDKTLVDSDSHMNKIIQKDRVSLSSVPQSPSSDVIMLHQQSQNAEKNQDGEETEAPLIYKGQLRSDCVFGVIMPLIFDERYQSIYQPILVILSSDNLRNVGCYTSGKHYTKMFFCTKFEGWNFNCKLLAIGRTHTELRVDLKVTCSLTHESSQMRKIITSVDKLTILENAPKLMDGELPPKKALCFEVLNDIFGIKYKKAASPEPSQTKTQIELVNDKMSSSAPENSHDKQQSNINSQKISNSNKTDEPAEKKSRKGPVPADLNLDKLPPRDNLFARASTAIPKCLPQNVFVSHYDTNTMVLRHIAEVVECLFGLYKLQREEEGAASIYCITQPDQTTKDLKMNRVFIEGVLELELSKYTVAMSKGKRGNPCSILRALVKYGFPKHYWSEVGLQDDDEGQDNQSARKPLSVVLGYPNPFSEPGKGKLDREMGEIRIKAIIDHVHRRAGRDKYTEPERVIARLNLSKVLSSLNKEAEKRENSQIKEQSFQVTDNEIAEDNVLNKINEENDDEKDEIEEIYHSDEVSEEARSVDTFEHIQDMIQEEEDDEKEIIGHVLPSDLFEWLLN